MTNDAKRPRRRLLVPELSAGEMQLPNDAAHYLRDVLRLARGDALELFDGKGNVALAQIVDLPQGGVRLRVEGARPVPGPSSLLTVGLAIPKGERADWAVEKLTELGVARIIWLQTERSVVVTVPSANKQQRWQRVAEAAARQAGRSDLPVLAGPLPLGDFLAETAPHNLIADASGVMLRDAVRPEASELRIAVGPEGGFARHELAAAQEAGYTAVRLGAWTLRVETAAVAAAAMLLGERF